MIAVGRASSRGWFDVVDDWLSGTGSYLWDGRDIAIPCLPSAGRMADRDDICGSYTDCIFLPRRANFHSCVSTSQIAWDTHCYFGDQSAVELHVMGGLWTFVAARAFALIGFMLRQFEIARGGIRPTTPCIFRPIAVFVSVFLMYHWGNLPGFAPSFG